jgi:hypothetical protein
MWIPMLVMLLLGAQLNLSALVPLQAGQASPPWFVGGRLIWPFGLDTRTLLAPGDALNTLTPLMAIGATVCFLMAAVALLRWWHVPGAWFPWLIVAGAACSIVLQVVWISGWAVLPLLLDAMLLWAVFAKHVTVSGLH